MTTIGEIVDFLDETFHPEYQEDYDNSGFLLGKTDIEVTGVLAAIDLTPNVIDEAITNGCNMIVTHHPFIFGGLKRITSDSEAGRMVFSLVEHGIAVYAAHTNLDNMKEGINGILANKLGSPTVAFSSLSPPTQTLVPVWLELFPTLSPRRSLSTMSNVSLACLLYAVRHCAATK